MLLAIAGACPLHLTCRDPTKGGSGCRGFIHFDPEPPKVKWQRDKSKNLSFKICVCVGLPSPSTLPRNLLWLRLHLGQWWRGPKCGLVCEESSHCLWPGFLSQGVPVSKCWQLCWLLCILFHYCYILKDSFWWGSPNIFCGLLTFQVWLLVASKGKCGGHGRSHNMVSYFLLSWRM